MMYWTYPSVSDADRLERAPVLDPTRVLLSPLEAADRIGAVAIPGETRLNTFDGRPVYRFDDGTGGERIIYADTGERQREVTVGQRDRIAAAWTGQPTSLARMESIERTDQWTLASSVRNLRPLYRYVWPNGEHVYVAGESGEVVQYTTRGSRLGAWVSAIPHWLYFTPLRVRQALWVDVIVWTALFATVSTVLGLVVGVWLYSPEKRYRASGRPSRVPFRGQKRWHTILGLIFGIGGVTWGFSGMMSVEPFPAFFDRLRPEYEEIGPARTDVAQALRGRVAMRDFDRVDLPGVLERNAGLGIRQIEFTSFDGEPMLAAHLGDQGVRMLTLDGAPVVRLDTARISGIIQDLAGGSAVFETRLIERYDLYYRDRNRTFPLPVLLIRLDDAAGTRFYIDPATARVVGGYDNRGWVGRWLYNALHSLDFPWLYNNRPLWDVVVIIFMLGGAVLSVTGVVLAWRRLTRWVGLTVSRPSPSTTSAPRSSVPLSSHRRSA